SRLRAVAMLVSGPTGMSVTSCGYLRTISRMNSAAGCAIGLVFGSGKTAPPSPFSPCAYAAVTNRRTRGAFAPAATGMSVRPAISTMRSAFGSVNSSGTLPATGVMPSIFSSGERMASNSASASSTPGSVSIMTREAPPLVRCSGVPAPCVAPRAKVLTAKVAADAVTKSRRLIREKSLSDGMFVSLFCLACWLRHQFDVQVVKLLRVHVELHCGFTFVRGEFGPGLPKQRLAITWPVIDVDVHVELFLSGNDRGIHHGGGGEFIPHEAVHRILGEVPRDWCVSLGDGRFHSRVHVSLNGNINRRDGDLLPRRTHGDAHRFGIEPPVEFSTTVNGVDAAFV